eukprot:2623159-Lingulodinium_polyedra.AAC.1
MRDMPWVLGRPVDPRVPRREKDTIIAKLHAASPRCLHAGLARRMREEVLNGADMFCEEWQHALFAIARASSMQAAD